MFYFKFVYNFVYLIILFINIKLDNNKNSIFFDEYINFDKIYLDNNIDLEYNNIVSYKEFLDIIFYFNID
tara:strand:- start:633 stop:842 length:210 start_codon:yes stop_codon:yes gene_type:complete